VSDTYTNPIPIIGGNGKVEPTPLRQAHHPVPHLDAKKSFTATAQADRLKEYIKDIPVLRARIVQAVTHLEALVASMQAELGLARVARKSFEEASEAITERFGHWEKDHGAPVTPAACAAPVSPADPAAGSAGAAPGPEPVGRA
jgi:hypothetical protein